MMDSEWTDDSPIEESDDNRAMELGWDMIVSTLESVAERRGCLVLSVDDMNAVNLDAPPYENNIVIDDNHMIALPLLQQEADKKTYYLLGTVVMLACVGSGYIMITLISIILGWLSS